MIIVKNYMFLHFYIKQKLDYKLLIKSCINNKSITNIKIDSNIKTIFTCYLKETKNESWKIKKVVLQATSIIVL